MRKLLNWHVPMLLRMIVVIAVVGISIAIAPDVVSGGLGGLLFWIVYFVFQCRAMGDDMDSIFGGIFEFIGEKGIYLSSALSGIGIIYGAFVFVTGGSSDETMGGFTVACVVYPILTNFFCVVRWILAAKRGAEDASGQFKYWFPIITVPIWSAVLVKYILTTPKIGFILCGVILVFCFIYALFSRDTAFEVEFDHRYDKSTLDHHHLGSPDYCAKWDNLRNEINDDIFYITGTVLVEYSGSVDLFSKEKAEKAAQKLIDQQVADIEKRETGCAEVRSKVDYRVVYKNK